MQLEHSFSVPVGIDEAWPILIDIERIGPCMPGAAIDSVDGDEFTGTVKVKLGPINLTYKGKAAFIEKDEQGRRAVIDARGRDARGNGTASAKITATLHDDGGGSTLVRVITDLDITGKPAQFGRGVMVDVGNKLLGQFADALAATIKGPEAGAAAAAPPDVPEVAEVPAAASEAALAAESAGTPEGDGPAEGEAASPAGSAAAAPGGSAAAAAAAETAAAVGRAAGPEPEIAADGTHAHAHAHRSPFKSHHEVEPIDLIQSVGPAIAKRLAPVLAGLLIVLLVIRRLRKD